MSSDAPRPRAAPGAAGRRFEQLAERYLRQQGLKTLARNYACRAGEIDLIMQDGDTLVFVEVRYRRSTRFGAAAETVDRRKQGRIIRAASHFLRGHGAHADRACRFDVVAFHGDVPAPTTNWIAGAFSA